MHHRVHLRWIELIVCVVRNDRYNLQEMASRVASLRFREPSINIYFRVTAISLGLLLKLPPHSLKVLIFCSFLHIKCNKDINIIRLTVFSLLLTVTYLNYSSQSRTITSTHLISSDCCKIMNKLNGFFGKIKGGLSLTLCFEIEY